MKKNFIILLFLIFGYSNCSYSDVSLRVMDNKAGYITNSYASFIFNIKNTFKNKKADVDIKNAVNNYRSFLDSVDYAFLDMCGEIKKRRGISNFSTAKELVLNEAYYYMNAKKKKSVGNELFTICKNRLLEVDSFYKLELLGNNTISYRNNFAPNR